MFEAELLDRRLRLIETIERAALAKLGYRDDLQVFDALLHIKAKGRNRQQRRAEQAMLVLRLIAQVRGHIAEGNATLAAYDALSVGARAEGLLLRAIDGARREKDRSSGGKTRVSQQRARWAGWQAIADGLSRRDESRLWAAIQVQSKLDAQKIKPLPKIETIRKRITYPKKAGTKVS